MSLSLTISRYSEHVSSYTSLILVCLVYMQERCPRIVWAIFGPRYHALTMPLLCLCYAFTMALGWTWNI